MIRFSKVPMTQKSLRTAIDNFKTISQTQAREYLKEKLTPLSDNHWTKGRTSTGISSISKNKKQLSAV